MLVVIGTAIIAWIRQQHALVMALIPLVASVAVIALAVLHHR